jgi:hypothetical protein
MSYIEQLNRIFVFESRVPVVFHDTMGRVNGLTHSHSKHGRIILAAIVIGLAVFVPSFFWHFFEGTGQANLYQQQVNMHSSLQYPRSRTIHLHECAFISVARTAKANSTKNNLLSHCSPKLPHSLTEGSQ